MLGVIRPVTPILENQLQWLDSLARERNTIMFAAETKKGT